MVFNKYTGYSGNICRKLPLEAVAYKGVDVADIRAVLMYVWTRESVLVYCPAYRPMVHACDM